MTLSLSINEVPTFQKCLDVIGNMGLVVDALSARGKRLSSKTMDAIVKDKKGEKEGETKKDSLKKELHLGGGKSDCC